MKGPILYTAEMDYGVEQRGHHGVFTDWYAHRHAPDLFKLGARSVAGYQPVIGGLAVMSVYQFADSDVFLTPAYPRMRDADLYGPEVRATRVGGKSAQTLYLERLALPAGDALINADWISVTRFAAPESEDEAIINWIRADAIKQLKSFGVKCVRFGTRIKQDIGRGSFRPRCMIFAEWAAQPPQSADLIPALTARFGTAITEAEPFVGWRAYPWPDDKSALKYL
jgi:hypothetical protein